ncbi:hypothetical protein J6590_103795 [Homalodisca vitripennis]|nr:hypothetical protein J6590_103795 [Homalodisca vitripennis]
MNRLRVLFRFKGLLQEEVKLKIVKAVVFPVIVYALPVFGGRPLRVACLVHKVWLTGKPSNLRGMLQTRAEIRDCHTRQDAMLEVPRVRLEMGRNRFRYFGPQIYNSVPQSLKAYGYSSFKNNLRLALEEECFTPK